MSLCLYLSDDFIFAARSNGISTTAIKFDNRDDYYSGCGYSRKDGTTLTPPYNLDNRLKDDILGGVLFLFTEDGESSLFNRLHDTAFNYVGITTEGTLKYNVNGTQFSLEEVFQFILRNVSSRVINLDLLRDVFLIIPDYYDQVGRNRLYSCAKSIFHKATLHFINQTSAMCMKIHEDYRENDLCLLLHFNSGPFEVSLAHMSKGVTTPVVSVMNDNVSGSDLVLNLLEIMEEKVRDKSLVPDYDVPEKAAVRRDLRFRTWQRLLSFAYYTGQDVELETGDGDCFYAREAHLARAFDRLAAELQTTVAHCCVLAGVSLGMVNRVVVSGPFCESLDFQPLLERLGSACDPTVVEERRLCEKVARWNYQKQILQCSLGVSIQDQHVLIVDRFAPYPLVERKQIVIPMENPESSLMLRFFQNRLQDRQQRIIKVFQLNGLPVYQGKVALTITLWINDSGIASAAVHDTNEQTVLIPETLLFSVCFKILFS